MATQMYIIKQENAVLEAKKAIQCAMKTKRLELSSNGGKEYAENRDCWGTMKLNVAALKRCCEEYLKEA